MKKSLIFLFSCAIPMFGMAQLPDHVTYETGMYALKMSPNGKWIGSMAGDAKLYDNTTGETIYYDGCFFGLGNTIANNGMAVGESADQGLIMYNGQIKYPETIAALPFCDLNGITADATRVTGVAAAPRGSGLMFCAMVADIDENGETGEVIFLPHPEKDFFNATPQYTTGVYISDDGKTVVGEVVDWRGMYSYPIVYKENDKGEWSYFLPTQHLFNPEGIELPENPWLSEPPYPEPEDFMKPVAAAQYKQAYENYQMSGFNDALFPDVLDYMDEDEWNAYYQAYLDYNDWYYSSQQRVAEYVQVYLQVLQTSPSFGGNEVVLHPSGDYFLTGGGMLDKDDNLRRSIFKFDCSNEDYEVYNIPRGGLYPHQVLSDGTVIATLPISSVPTSYIKLPESNEFISLKDYLKPTFPEIADWLDDTFPGGSGIVCMSDDKSVITGGLLPDHLLEYDQETANFYYSSYILNDVAVAGVESIEVAPTDGTYRVFNLQGVKMLETKDANALKSLPTGIYIINGKKILL